MQNFDISTSVPVKIRNNYLGPDPLHPVLFLASGQSLTYYQKDHHLALVQQHNIGDNNYIFCQISSLFPSFFHFSIHANVLPFTSRTWFMAVI